MRDLQNLELQAVNGGASTAVIGVGIAAICLVSIVAVSVMSRKSQEPTVVVLPGNNTSGTGTSTTVTTTAS